MGTRRTLAGEADVSGFSLFLPVASRLFFRPADAGKGIMFLRKNVRLPGGPAQQIPNLDARIPATIDSVKRPAPAEPLSARNTTLANRFADLGTVEHAMSALAGLGVTDAIIEFTAREAPIFDGSATEFVKAIQRAGVRDLDRSLDPLVLTTRVEVSDAKGATIVASPRSTPGFSYTYHLDYGPQAPIPPQSFSWDGDPDRYARDIAPARTFCLRHEAEALKSAGYLGSLTPKDMLVFGDDGKPIDNALRFSDEPARHKLLDLIGDLALLGRPIQADVVATRSGHALTHDLVRRLAREAGESGNVPSPKS